jgi:hypothetical protein
VAAGQVARATRTGPMTATTPCGLWRTAMVPCSALSSFRYAVRSA